MRSGRQALRCQPETADRVPPIHGGAQTSSKFGFRPKSKDRRGSLNLEASTRLTVGLGRLPDDVTSVADKTPKGLDEFLDRDLATRAEVDRLGPVVTFGGKNNPSRGGGDKQELEARRPVSPDFDIPQSPLFSLDNFPDQRRYYVRGGGIKVV